MVRRVAGALDGIADGPNGILTRVAVIRDRAEAVGFPAVLAICFPNPEPGW